ncbi:nucleoside triphosphate pyrophosphohydrolase [Paenibacillus harenae]|uniref:nucleoside triphosphate pyrophosphohydrolase n=1 Tax=Paenibacillus harenae TaxID=306543 RepID=UPI00278DAFF8|nr:nucleoside triphosphate pyrophosphohydrolase [Paenibacillus harenae]MDQ0063261.1 putative house-cleaning noncanonical NTP pyrophosphatase (MazG superfamily) [Paenibacillus harenae]
MTNYNKLVRDRIPEIITNQGMSFTTRVLENDEYKTELLAKLKEETNEFIEAKSGSEASEELADMLEVIHALAETIGVTVQELERIRADKAVKRGGFMERVYLIEVVDA